MKIHSERDVDPTGTEVLPTSPTCGVSCDLGRGVCFTRRTPKAEERDGTGSGLTRGHVNLLIPRTQ